MRKEMAGGGVLMDMGPHYFDELLFLFDGPGEILSYSDNSLGGIESDCKLQLRLSHQGKSIDGRVELSRTRNLRNSILISCERGILEMLLDERFRILVKPKELELKDPLFSQSRPFELGLAWSDETESNWYEAFRTQIDDWMEAIYARKTSRLSGRSVLPSVRLIDECYRKAKRIIEPWAGHPMCTATSRATDTTVSGSSRKPFCRVLITGATGFIGCRLAEILSQRDGYEVRALTHNPANAARLARLPVELVQADLCFDKDIRRVVQGCDAIVHCAIGTSYGQPRKIFEVTVGGTRRIVEAALNAGLSRFVHISSIAVCGNNVTGILDETTPTSPVRGDNYSQSKAVAEQAVFSAQKRGLSTVILRPACVYGPHGTTFVTRPIHYMARNRLILQGCADIPSNTVYVDNLVEAIILSLEINEAGQEVFTICDDDGMTWGEFYGFFADALGGKVRNEHLLGTNNGNRPGNNSKVGMFKALREVLSSSECKEFVKKVLSTDPLGSLPRHVLEHAPWLEQWLRRRMGSDKPVIYVREPDVDGDTLSISPVRAVVSADKARRLLKYTPLVSRQQALQRTLEWIRYSR
jgi:nucleoside-diphosphate-sugar epimerase